MLPFFAHNLPITLVSVRLAISHPTEMESPRYNGEEEHGYRYRTGTESGYASGSSIDEAVPEVYFSRAHLRFLNRQLQNLEPSGTMSNSAVPVA